MKPAAPKGFNFTANTVKVTLAGYADDDNEAPWLRLRRISIGDLLDLVELAAVAERLQNDGRPSADDLAAIAPLFTMVANNIIEWNFRDGNTPVDPTVDNVRKVDLMMMLEIVGGWMGALGDVPAPLDGASPNGKPPPGLFEETAPLSPFPPNSSTHA